jgi:hypothetical protein
LWPPPAGEAGECGVAADSDLTHSLGMSTADPLAQVRHEMRAAAERARRDIEAAQANLALARRNLREAECALEEAERQKAAALALETGLRAKDQPSPGQQRDTLTRGAPVLARKTSA